MPKSLVSCWYRVWYHIGRYLSSPLDLTPQGKTAASPPRHSRLRLILLLIALAMIFGAEAFSRALLPLLLRDHPLLLITLDSHTHDLLLAGVKLDAAEFISVAVIWRFAVHLVYFLLGRWYGAASLGWLDTKWRPAGSFVKRVELVFSRVSNLAVFVFSDNVVCALAGSVGMPLTRFAALHLLGTVLHIVVLLAVIRRAHGPLDQAVTFIDSDTALLTVIFTAATVVSVGIAITLHRSKVQELLTMIRRADKAADASTGVSDPPTKND